MLANFNPAPSKAVQQKIDFYFAPYSPEQSVSKYMRFKNEELEAEQRAADVLALTRLSVQPAIE